MYFYKQSESRYAAENDVNNDFVEIDTSEGFKDWEACRYRRARKTKEETIYQEAEQVNNAEAAEEREI